MNYQKVIKNYGVVTVVAGRIDKKKAIHVRRIAKRVWLGVVVDL